MTTQAAMDGITANGHRWKFRMSGLIKPETTKLGEFNDRESDGETVPREESEPVVMTLITKVRNWLGSQRTLEPNMGADILDSLEYLESVEDCEMEEINYAMDRLYDDFDFWRVLV